MTGAFASSVIGSFCTSTFVNHMGHYSRSLFLATAAVIAGCSRASTSESGSANKVDDVDIVGSIAYEPLAGIDDVTEAHVRAALIRTYAFAEVQREKNAGLWFDGQTDVERIEFPVLEHALPGVRFYKTSLFTPYPMCYAKVGTIVAAWVDAGQMRIAACQSPVYTNPGEGSLEMLIGARAESDAEKRAVGKDIANLFASITYRSAVESAELDGPVFRADVTHFERFWRRIVVSFEAGRVASVALTLRPGDPTPEEALQMFHER
jgi:hypothetical protein